MLFDLREMQIWFFAAAKTTSPLQFHVKIAITTAENAAQRKGRKERKEGEGGHGSDRSHPHTEYLPAQNIGFHGLGRLVECLLDSMTLLLSSKTVRLTQGGAISEKSGRRHRFRNSRNCDIAAAAVAAKAKT